jgi:hypothetical protein
MNCGWGDGRGRPGGSEEYANARTRIRRVSGSDDGDCAELASCISRFRGSSGATIKFVFARRDSSQLIASSTAGRGES